MEMRCLRERLAGVRVGHELKETDVNGGGPEPVLMADGMVDRGNSPGDTGATVAIVFVPGQFGTTPPRGFG